MAPYPPRHCSQALPISFASTGLLENKCQEELQGHLLMESEERSADCGLWRCDCQKLQPLAVLAICSFISRSRKSLQIKPSVGGSSTKVCNAREETSFNLRNTILRPEILPPRGEQMCCFKEPYARWPAVKFWFWGFICGSGSVERVPIQLQPQIVSCLFPSGILIVSIHCTAFPTHGQNSD